MYVYVYLNSFSAPDVQLCWLYALKQPRKCHGLANRESRRNVHGSGLTASLRTTTLPPIHKNLPLAAYTGLPGCHSWLRRLSTHTTAAAQPQP